ncbi:MAG TPA: helix-turn-helix domain-containing protein, partial [Acidobacteriota bacterium]|nr:helix-turn-helix domain-containing protein [Acidobacteriota bacterium]
MASLGYELKQAREAKGVTLTQLAENTRIGIRFLQAIESDDFKSLPGGLFNRSFIKAYARAVGIDEDEAVIAYQKQTGDGPANSDAQLNNIPTYT